MRCSVYARFSSDLQRDTSLDDQIAVAQRYAAERGWHLDPEHVYRDAGVSGASMEGRAGLEALLAGAGQQPRPFDIVLVDDTSRVARDIADAIRIMQCLTFWGIRVIYISQGIDSASEQADALVTVHGLIDSLYLKELAKKVYASRMSDPGGRGGGEDGPAGVRMGRRRCRHLHHHRPAECRRLAGAARSRTMDSDHHPASAE
jgi:DNA invertase Pin-like site-specific DNA recombinase